MADIECDLSEDHPLVATPPIGENACVAAADEIAPEEATASDPVSDEHEVGSEIRLHVIGLGENTFGGTGWAGAPGGRHLIEALSICPFGLDPGAIEVKVIACGERATPWTPGGHLAGSRGRRLPLFGYAIRAAEGYRDQLEIAYQGHFAEGGPVGPIRDGALCVSPIPDDPLEAVRVQILQRARPLAQDRPRTGSPDASGASRTRHSPAFAPAIPQPEPKAGEERPLAAPLKQVSPSPAAAAADSALRAWLVQRRHRAARLKLAIKALALAALMLLMVAGDLLWRNGPAIAGHRPVPDAGVTNLR
jgi:hypothetical protein